MTSEASKRRRPPGLGGTLRAALNGGATAGLLLGLADGLVAGLRTGGATPLQWAGCLAASALSCGIAWAGLLLLLSPLLHLRLRGRGLLARSRYALALALGLGLFLELYWWSRPHLDSLTGGFADDGLSAAHPRRLLVTAGLLVAGLLLGRLAVAVGRRLPRGLRAAVPFAVLILWAGGALFLLAQGAADPRGKVGERTRDMPNVLLFVVDALRQDVLGPYGNQHVQTPVIDELAARGVVFENAFVQAPFTWSSFGSILTGKYPRRHGLVKMAPGVRMAPNVTLPWHLKQAGLIREEGHLEPDDYIGSAFLTGTLSHGSGLLRGFDVYLEQIVGHGLTDSRRRWSTFRSELLLFLIANKIAQRLDEAPVATAAREWCGENASRRFVSMVHYYSTHTPYDPPQRFRDLYCDPQYDGYFKHGFTAQQRQMIEKQGQKVPPEHAEYIRGLYYGGVTQADEMIGEVLEALADRGVLDDTIVIVTSDHGEELGDHDLWEHNFMFQTNLEIPLIMAGPGIPRGGRVPAMVETVDLVPTLCELLGVVSPHNDEEPDKRGHVDGVSLVPLMRGEVESVKRFSFAENGRFLSVQNRRHKLIVRPADLLEEGWARVVAGEAERPRFFDLEVDPDEMENRFDPDRPEVLRLLAVLRAWDDRMPVPRSEMLESHRDLEAERRHFEALGYTGDGIGAGVDEDPPEEDQENAGSR